MTFRYARHSNDLEAMLTFYTEIIGLNLLWRFDDHSSYSGIFLGKEGLDWHLEFTSSTEPANHQADADDLLVFYVENEAESEAIYKKAKAANCSFPKSKNPYWQRNAFEITDPDGFGVIICVRQV